jgi:hypothetical protein
MLRKAASILFLLTAVVIGLGAFGHDSNTAKLTEEFAKFSAFDTRAKAIIVAVWHFCSGCMFAFGAILVWTWQRIRNGARDVFFAPLVIGALYVASGALSVGYTGVAFFWLFVVLGGLLIATSLILRSPRMP